MQFSFPIQIFECSNSLTVITFFKPFLQSRVHKWYTMYKNRLPLINVLTHVTQESGLTKYTPYYMASHSSQKSAAIAAGTC
ncbi:hypothetical protein RIR_jg29755.t1 [Rhizophagus irregularis DAOM 181602=DAOM 197198]|nr:hypothetical protein RIR_jg29755.t1 [Rhizophagus irregularis DAOM 181602=DAOM 197198]